MIGRKTPTYLLPLPSHPLSVMKVIKQSVYFFPFSSECCQFCFSAQYNDYGAIFFFLLFEHWHFSYPAPCMSFFFFFFSHLFFKGNFVLLLVILSLLLIVMKVVMTVFEVGEEVEKFCCSVSFQLPVMLCVDKHAYLQINDDYVFVWKQYLSEWLCSVVLQIEWVSSCNGRSYCACGEMWGCSLRFSWADVVVWLLWASGACLYFQYPLKEVVAISNDPKALENARSLEKYILEVSFAECCHLVFILSYNMGMTYVKIIKIKRGILGCPSTTEGGSPGHFTITTHTHPYPSTHTHTHTHTHVLDEGISTVMRKTV